MPSGKFSSRDQAGPETASTFGLFAALLIRMSTVPNRLQDRPQQRRHLFGIG